MSKDYFDKLKVLANNDKEYIKAIFIKLKLKGLLIKLRSDARTNNHDMSQFQQTDGHSDGKDLWTISYTSYCRKCIFQIDLDHMNTVSGEKVYLTPTNLNIKCVR